MIAFCEWWGSGVLRHAWLMGFLFPNQGLNLNSRKWNHGILTTCLQGNFLFLLMKCVQEVVFFLLENLHCTEGYVFGSCVLLVSHVEWRVICKSSFWIYFPCYVGLLAMLCPTLTTPWTIACQAPLSMRFSRQECESGLPCPPPGIFPTWGLNPCLLHCSWILNPPSHLGSPHFFLVIIY